MIESNIDFRTPCVIMRAGGVIANDVLVMGKVIEFLNSWFFVYYKIHFCVLPHPFCAGEVSVVIVIDK